MCFKWRLFRQEDPHFTEQDKIYEKMEVIGRKALKHKKALPGLFPVINI